MLVAGCWLQVRREELRVTGYGLLVASAETTRRDLRYASGRWILGRESRSDTQEPSLRYGGRNIHKETAGGGRI
jgi:hypothetical protein